MSRQDDSDNDVVHLAQVVDAIRKGWLRIAACILLSLVLAGILFTFIPANYSARAAVALQVTPGNSSITGSNPTVNVATETQVVTSSSVAGPAAKILGSKASPSQLASQVVVSSPLSSQLLEIRFTADSPEEAAAGANAFAKAYIDYRTGLATSILNNRSQRLQERLAALETERASAQAVQADSAATAEAKNRAAADQARTEALSRELWTQLVLIQTTFVSPGEIVDHANPPTSRDFPQLKMFLAAGGLLGTIAGFVLAFVGAVRNPRVTRESDLAPFADNRIIAPIPVAKGRTARTRGAPVLGPNNSAHVDAYRALASKIVPPKGERLRVLIFPAGAPGQDDSPLGLAVTLASQGLTVALLGTSTAVAQSANAMSAASKGSIAGHLVAPTEGVHEVARIGRLRLISLGDDIAVDATYTLHRPDVDALTADADIVVVDGIDISQPSTALSLARFADEALVVVQLGRTTLTEVRDALSQLEQVHTRTHGFILRTPQSRSVAQDATSLDLVDRLGQSPPREEQSGVGADRAAEEQLTADRSG